MRLLVAVAFVIVAIGVMAGFALADPNLGDIPRHQHYIQTPNGDFVPVGPDVCDNPNLQKAFNQFHNNLHVVSSTGIGPAAPGLHNHKGGELFAGPCPS